MNGIQRCFLNFTLIVDLLSVDVTSTRILTYNQIIAKNFVRLFSCN